MGDREENPFLMRIGTYTIQIVKIASRNTFQYNNYNQVSLNKAERLNENELCC